MGINKRYAHVVDARTDALIIQSLMRTASPERCGERYLVTCTGVAGEPSDFTFLGCHVS